jgi:hypothetical protein
MNSKTQEDYPKTLVMGVSMRGRLFANHLDAQTALVAAAAIPITLFTADG